MANTASSPAAVPVRRIAYVPTGLIITLVLLRLCIGWHFWREGTKKLAYNPATGRTAVAFTAEPMLRLAVGSLAPKIREQLPNFHDWESLLAKPWALRPMTDKEQAEQDQWERDYAARRAEAKKKGEEPPFEFPPQLSYAQWATRISEDWQATVEAFKQLPDMSDVQKKAAGDVLEARRQQLKDYLATQATAIAEWKNELFRLQAWEAEAGAEGIPFQMDRIKEKKSETAAASAAWIEQVRTIERGLNHDLRQVLNAEQAANRGITEQLNSILADADDVRMHRINVAVTCVVIGVGVCLILGLFTRLASLAGILFLLAVIATQPPWVAGAKTEVFYYQLVEVAALLVLFASAAGRWAGLDFFIRGLFGKCCGRKESTLK
jgi:uncharacterized membrane protein YphA (DoxX/SURF4 family)